MLVQRFTGIKETSPERGSIGQGVSGVKHGVRFKGAVGLAAIIASVYKRNWNAWHSAVVMNDKRDTQQQKVIRAGTISFDGSGIDCLVRNMSVGGANLEVESQIGIPSSFDLVINVERSNHRCHVVWRKARRIGVAFD